jgi:cyclopropane fatty-acyl-phospholipid synthase-like methyltransferase
MQQILTKDFRKLKSDWDNAALTDVYREYIAQGYSEEDAFRKSGEDNTKGIRGFLNQYGFDWKDKIVVELGCGAGRMTEFIAKDAKHVQAIDISAEMLKRLHERLGYERKIETLCIIRDYSVISDLSADLIISFLVFQHTPEDMVERLIQDGRRILKSGGYYFFQIPLSSKHKCVPVNEAQALDMVYWTLDEVKELAIKYHFEIIAEPKDPSQSQLFIFKKP